MSFENDMGPSSSAFEPIESPSHFKANIFLQSSNFKTLCESKKLNLVKIYISDNSNLARLEI